MNSLKSICLFVWAATNARTVPDFNEDYKIKVSSVSVHVYIYKIYFNPKCKKGMITCPAMHGNVDNVDDITKVVHEVPQFWAEVLQLPEHSAPYNNDHVVQHCQRHDGQPTEVELGRRVQHQEATEPKDLENF